MARLLVIRNAQATGRADCVAGEVSIVKPNGSAFSALEQSGFTIIDCPLMPVATAEDIYLRRVPQLRIDVELAEAQRVRDDSAAAVTAASAELDEAEQTARQAASDAFDFGFLLVPLNAQELTLTTEQRRAIVMLRHGAIVRRRKRRDVILRDVTPFDETKRVRPERWPLRKRHIDLAAYDANPGSKTPAQLAAMTVTKSDPVDP